MESNYSQLTEEEKEARREAHRKWAAKNDRTEYHRQYESRRKRDPRYRMFANSKKNAKEKGFEHSITIDDIVIEENCPCCGEPMSQPSCDRVDNSKGYVKGNVAIICWTCNNLKGFGTAKQHLDIARFIENHQDQTKSMAC